MASVQKSERTSPREGFVSGGLVTEQSGFYKTKTNTTTMKDWNQIKHYAGFDWAKDHHDVIILDASGKIAADFRFEHTASGWEQFREKIADFPDVAIAIETKHGTAIERLLEMECCIFPVHPQSAKAYRQRKVPSGNKTDRVDAWSLADALRMDGVSWKRLAPQEPLIKELRLICRDEVALIRDRTALITQLRQSLYDYYPAALEAFDDWTMAAAWAFVIAFPTPQTLVKAGKGKWEKFLHVHKLGRPETYKRRLEIFARATQFAGSLPVINAKSRLAVARAKQLQLLETQIGEYRREIRRLFAQHPDATLFDSLPGAGEKIAPRLLSEIGDDRALFPNAQALQCLAGTAPVSFQSGQIHRVHLRRQCNKSLRNAVHLWANLSREFCPWAATYYTALRAKGKSHACALRALGQRWLKIVWKMWQARTPYDADLHARNQLKHGSWVLQLVNQPVAAKT
jgi:transposase